MQYVTGSSHGLYPITFVSANIILYSMSSLFYSAYCSDTGKTSKTRKDHLNNLMPRLSFPTPTQARPTASLSSLFHVNIDLYRRKPTSKLSTLDSYSVIENDRRREIYILFLEVCLELNFSIKDSTGYVHAFGL